MGLFFPERPFEWVDFDLPPTNMVSWVVRFDFGTFSFHGLERVFATGRPRFRRPPGKRGSQMFCSPSPSPGEAVESSTNAAGMGAFRR